MTRRRKKEGKETARREREYNKKGEGGLAKQAGIKQEIRVSHLSWRVCKDRASAFERKRLEKRENQAGHLTGSGSELQLRQDASGNLKHLVLSSVPTRATELDAV